MDPLILPFEGHAPVIHESAFVAPGAVVIGHVEIGPEASVWYGCVLRGDTNRISVGARSNVQDGTIVHVDAEATGGLPVLIGEDVLVGHRCTLHGCTARDGAFVGMGSTLLDGSVVETGGFLAACAFLTPGKTVPADEMWGGLPARRIRALKDGEAMAARMGSAHYVEEARRHARALREHEDGTARLRREV